MAKKTISQALKDLFLGLGGDASALADNTSASDYIQDLESAIKTAASGASENLIDDSEASETTVYSSSKVESLIPANELPTPVEANVGKVATVVSDGEDGYEWSAESVVVPQELPTPTNANVGKVATVVSDGEGGYEWSAEDIEAVSFFLANRNAGAHTFQIDSNLAYFGLTFDKLYEFFKSPSILGFSIKKYGGIFVDKMGFSDNGSFSMENFIPCIGTYQTTENNVTHKSIIFHGIIRETDDFGDLKYYTINCILTDSLTGGTYTQTEIT